ncbi:KEOPS complex subunit Cgi121 [uncultured Methanobrevibacter sp.]|uniref:KEOPS complex subunit Cgi121 n=1 Tax=uncultured Methanobrevibacter sp. TaxID=253161 RepID=UPI0025F1A68A|nr:KEOPS complex subunit Cgi121 [uncultured Methanobrevibacter sp.]
MKEYNKELAELGNVEILGFTGTIESIPKTLDQVDNIRNGCCDVRIIQLMNADAIAGKIHLQHGIIHAMNAFERGMNLAKDLGIEILLRTSGQRQISKAFDILGLKEGEMNIAVVMIDCPDYFIDELSKYFTRNDAVLEADESKLIDLYDIPEKELKSMHIVDVLIDKTSKLIVDQ